VLSANTDEPVARERVPVRLLRPELTKTDCLPECEAADYRVCRNDAECVSVGGSCRRVNITSAGGIVELGICL
jgi:hypothetical protein